MKRLFLTLASILIVSIGLMAKEKMSVLYVGGSPDINVIGVAPIDQTVIDKSVKERTADFTKFLKKHFTKVTAIDGKEYTADMSDAYDVTIFDGKPKELKPEVRVMDENGRVVEYKSPEYLPSDFDRAAICIAETSENLGRSLGSKNDWFCLCLDNYALGWKKDHPIFRGPFKVNIVSEMLPTPESAKEYCPIYGYTLPEQTEMWMAHTPVTQESNKRIGMVSRPWGYTDSPDAEVISGGKCAKSIDAVAIGRHGNLFHWGFAAKPSDMTEPARAAFANTIVYMKDFNGKHPIARKLNENMATRASVIASKYYDSRACNESIYKMEQKFFEYMDSTVKAIESKQANGEPLNPSEMFYLQIPAPQPPVKKSFAEYIREREPALYHIFGEDEAEYARYYEKNAPYFYPTANGYTLDIDEDVRELGIANNDIRMLDKAIEKLGNGGRDAELGRRVLERYTLCRFTTPQEWKEWLDANRDRMFFTESGGWLWLVDTLDPSVPGNDYSVLTSPANKEADAPTAPAGETDNNNPVALKAEIANTPDGCKDIVITMTVHDGFHTYATLADGDPFIPTEITVELPEGYEKTGELKLPVPSPSATATTYYTGTGRFIQRVKGSGAGKAICKVRYQACNESMCMPPVTKAFELEL